MHYPYTQENNSLLKKIALAIALVLGALVSYWLKFDMLLQDVRYLAVIALSVVLVIITPVQLRNDEVGSRLFWLSRELYNSAMLLLPMLGILLLIGFGFKITAYFSREWSFYWVICTVICYPLIMSGYVLFFSRTEEVRVLVIGGGEIGEKIGAIARRWPGVIIMGYLDDNPDKLGKTINGVPVLGKCQDAKTILANSPVAEVWITLPFRASHVIEDIIFSVSDQPVTIRYFPDVHVFNLLNHSASSIAGHPVLVLNDSPLKGNNRLLKMLEDYILSLIILVLISPLLLGITLVIYLTSGGPVLYKQKRHGAGGKPINVYKFRTMHQQATGNGKVVQATLNDTRITTFGRFLRRTSFDELPQFLNVLQGRMSIVGPRPHAVEHNAHYQNMIERYMLRHKVKPGITGWAQVNGYRGETDTLEKMEKRVEYDLFYIQNWSVWFDMKIIFLTIFKGFIHKNAY